MARIHFRHTVVGKNSSTGEIEALEGVLAEAFNVVGNAEASAASIFTSRTGTTLSSGESDANGIVSFWLNPGDYQIHFSDPVIPPRIADFVIGVPAVSGSAQGILKTQLPALVSSDISDLASVITAPDSVTSAMIATDAVGPSEIAANAVGSAELADASVTKDKLALLLAQILGVNTTSVKRRGTVINEAAELLVTSSGGGSHPCDDNFLGAMPTRDLISGIVVPANSLLAVQYQARMEVLPTAGSTVAISGSISASIMLNNAKPDPYLFSYSLVGSDRPTSDGLDWILATSGGIPTPNGFASLMLSGGGVMQWTGLNYIASGTDGTLAATPFSTTRPRALGGGQGGAFGWQESSSSRQGPAPPIALFEVPAGTYNVEAKFLADPAFQGSPPPASIRLGNRHMRAWVIGFD